MPVNIEGPNGQILLETELLSQSTFSAFGTVITNPAPSLIPSSNLKTIPPNALQANQGSALKYLDVTHMKDFYGSAPSRQPAKAVMSMFVCAPRNLFPSPQSCIQGLFPVEILERHPYTTQTFIPLGISPLEAEEARYLVIVAPSLPPSSADSKLPVPASTANSGSLPGRGFPDLQKIRAFIANGSQAVTYGAGTWHAPMVAIGKKPISFVVVQFANGVGIEDCQEVVWKGENGNGICAPVPRVGSGPHHGMWKL
jgi:ureidoglycolate lyase